MRITIILFFCLAFYRSQGGDPKYPVNAIPPELKVGMYAVIREQSTTFEISDFNRSSLTIRRVITVLSKKGEGGAKMEIGYDKLTTIEYFRGVVYDAAGMVIRKLKQSEIRDQSNVSGFSLYEDDRMKIADLTQSAYPYTVEFEYHVQYNYLYWIPDFELYDDDEISAEQESYTVIYSKLNPPRFRTYKIGEPSRLTLSDGRESVSWSFKKVVPEKFEKEGPDLRRIVPNIQAAPDQFEYAGYRGRMDTWENYGKWQIQLNKDRDILPERTITAVKELTANLKSREEKVKAVYELLQSKTRYVSIQLGIGGWQPFEARVVDEVGYGDCKALSNYTVAMLKSIGIKAYYAKIYGGEDNKPVIADFVKNYFNHIVVAVPNETDTLWLECTSQTDPFGYQGSFTGGRKALIVTEEGGKLVNTTSYQTELNVKSRRAEVLVEGTGNAKAKVKTTYSGLQYEDGYLNFYVYRQKDDQKKWLEHSIGIPSFDINSFTITNNKARIPSAMVEVDLTLNRYATVSGKRLFLTPNLMNRSTYVPESYESRKTDFVKATGYIDFDTIHYSVPQELYPEFLPNPVTIKSRFGEYEASFKLDQGGVLYTRKVIIHKGEFPPDSYNDMISFYKSINKADNLKLVFLNKT